jgi:WD40 repeat protein
MLPTFLHRHLKSSAAGTGPKQSRRTAAAKQPILRRLCLELLEDRLCLSTIAYWRFEEGIADQPAMGTGTILDSSGNDLNGTPINGPVYRADIGDNPIPQTGEENFLSLDFERANRQRIFIADDPAFQLTHSLTLEAYIKPTAPGGGPYGLGQILFRGDDRPALDPYYLAMQGNDLLFHIEGASGRYAEVRASLPGLDQWLHVAATLGDATGQLGLYINGDLAASGTTAIRPFAELSPPDNPGFGIGNVQSPNYDEYFQGLIDEVRISDVALTPDQFLNAATIGAADHLLFLRQPTDTAPGQTISPVIVGIVDASGHLVSDDNTDTVTISIGNNPGGGTLSGTHTVTVSNGVAEFDDLSIDLAGDGYTLHAITDGLTPADSSPFNITTAAADHYQLSGPGLVVGDSPKQFTLTALDASGNPSTDYRGTVTFSSTDPQAVLPDAYTFTADDAGSHTFTITLHTAGPQTITAQDTFGGSLTIEDDVRVTRTVWLVATHANSNVVRYDSQTGAFIDTFVAPGSLDDAIDAVIGPDGNLYATSRQDNKVPRYDGHTGAYLGDFVTTGSGGLSIPVGLVFRDGYLYVSSDGSNSVLRYDATTGAFVGAFVPSGSEGLAGVNGLFFGPDGNLYVNSVGNSTVMRYDGTTGAPLPAPGQTGAFFVSAHSGGLDLPYGQSAFGPDGNLYVASYATSSLLRYDGSTGAFLDAFVPGGSGGLLQPIGLSFGPDGNLYLVSQGSGNILRYDGSPGAFLGVFSGPGYLLEGGEELNYWDLDAPGPAPAPSHSHRPTVQHPSGLDFLLAQPAASQPQALLPRGPDSAGGLAAAAQGMAPEMMIGPVSRAEPPSPAVAVWMARPVHDAVFGGWSDRLQDVLATDLWT